MTAEVSTGGYTTAFLLCPHPLQLKVESPDGIFGTTWGFTGLFLPEEAADPASTGPQTHRRIAKLRRSPQIKFPCLGSLSYLFIQKKIYFPPSAGRWLDTDNCVIGTQQRNHGLQVSLPPVASPQRIQQNSPRSWLSHPVQSRDRSLHTGSGTQMAAMKAFLTVGADS